MHPRVCVSAISTFKLDLAADLEFWAAHRIDCAGVSVAKLAAFGWDEGTRRVADAVGAGLRVANLIGLGPFVLTQPQQWEQQRERLVRALEAGRAMNAGCVVFTTGPAGPLPWEEAADALETALAPVLLEARAIGIPFAVEHTNSLRVDVGFVHSLHDVVDLARRLGTGVCMEINACWAERGLAETIAAWVAAVRYCQNTECITTVVQWCCEALGAASCAGSHSSASARSTVTGKAAAISSAARKVSNRSSCPGHTYESSVTAEPAADASIGSRSQPRRSASTAPASNGGRSGAQRSTKRTVLAGSPPAGTAVLVAVTVESQVEPRARTDLEEPQRSTGAPSDDREPPGERGRPSDLVGLRRAAEGVEHRLGAFAEQLAIARPCRVGVAVAARRRKVRGERGRLAGKHHPVHTAEQPDRVRGAERLSRVRAEQRVDGAAGVGVVGHVLQQHGIERRTQEAARARLQLQVLHERSEGLAHRPGPHSRRTLGPCSISRPSTSATSEK